MSFGTIALLAVAGLFALVGLAVPSRARLIVWMVIVMAGVIPWSDWVGHPHWYTVEWIPFSRYFRVRDIALNLLLYFPLGWFVATAGRSRLAVVTWAAACGLALSLVTEASQIYSHGRFPAMTDVLMNTVGAVVGAVVRRR